MTTAALPLLGLVLLTAGAGCSEASVVIAPRAWSVLGPYPSGDAGDLARPLPPEGPRDFARALPGAGGEGWLAWGQPAAGDRLILPALPAAAGPSIAYAVTYIDAPVAARARLVVAEPERRRVWLDRDPIAADATVDLAPGLHELLVKQRSADPSDPLQVTCTGPDGLRFLPQPPWPLRQLPAEAWRCLRRVEGRVAAVRAALSADGLGLPPIPGGAWEAPAAGADGVSCEGAAFLATHIFFPLKYHLQSYRIRLAGARPAAAWLDGQRLAFDSAADGTVTATMPSHRLRAGFNRLVLEPRPGDGGMVKVEISDPGDLKYAPEPPPALDPGTTATAWPEAVISNGQVTARIALPDDERGLYRGNRFERAGIIARLEHRGHTYFLGAPAAARPLDHGVCYGPAEEWFEALAWHDAAPGQEFLKMGVGLFERPAHPLHMWYCAYWPRALLPWTSRIADGAAGFTQVCEGPRGWGYRYTKRLVLVPGRPILRIEHELENTGRHPIAGEQYNHNFLLLDGRPPQAGYRCQLSFAPRPSKDIGGWTRIDGGAIALTAPPPGQVGCELAGWSDPVADQTFTVSCAGTPAAVTVSGDAPLTRLVLFAGPDYLAVEPFVRIEARPGATARWTRSYAFSAE